MNQKSWSLGLINVNLCQPTFSLSKIGLNRVLFACGRGFKTLFHSQLMKFILLVNTQIPAFLNILLLNKAEHEIYSANKY